ncbi:MAG: pilus assembly protein [Chloroflexota bacterium]|nr:pilus assembly protein [Chloroflexota bacterium]
MRAVGGQIGRDEGQSLVEFALAVPVFVLLLMGLLEFGFLYNNILTVQFASRQGVSAAAQVGGEDGADCAILKAVEAALSVPIDKTRVTAVEVFQSDANGDPMSGRINRYARSGTLDCPGTATEPYTLVGSEGYPQTERHDALSEGLDIIGVRIEYLYVGITPLGSGRTWRVSDGATLRVEPKQ